MYICDICNCVLWESERKSHIVSHPNKIIDGLYIGNEINAKDKTWLDKNGITHILNVAIESSIFYPTYYKYMHLEIYDDADQQIANLFDNAYKFIDDALQNKGKVLIHCIMGMSRSASFAIFYLMKKYNLSYDEAYTKMKSCRWIISPSKNFEKQLRAYDNKSTQINKYQKNDIMSTET